MEAPYDYEQYPAASQIPFSVDIYNWIVNSAEVCLPIILTGLKVTTEVLRVSAFRSFLKKISPACKNHS